MRDEVITETKRLILRRFEERDLQDLYEYLSDADVVKYEQRQEKPSIDFFFDVSGS